MIVTAKFQVSSVTEFAGQGGKSIVMHPVTTGSEENKKFWAATPTGKIEMSIRPGDAADAFRPGDEILIDFHMPEPKA